MDKLLLQFLYYYAKTVDISTISQKGVKPGVNRNDYLNLRFPLAPLPEQQRLVAKLDALLSRIGKAIELLRECLALLDQTYSSALEEAFNPLNAQKNSEELYNLPDGWKWMAISDVANFIGGSQPEKSKFSTICHPGYVRLIQIRDYKSDKYIVYIDAKSTKKFCTKDDVMIGRYGPPVFQILKGLEGAYNVALMKAVPINEDVLIKDYLYWFLKSPPIQHYVISVSQRAAGQSGVNKRSLEKYPIPFPLQLDEQQRIAEKLDMLTTKHQQSKDGMTAQITRLEQLKASILDAAFKGAL